MLLLLISVMKTSRKRFKTGSAGAAVTWNPVAGRDPGKQDDVLPDVREDLDPGTISCVFSK